MSSHRAIENLIAMYAELVDDGDFAGIGILLGDATFTGGAGSVSGRVAIEKMLRDSLIVYDDGTPRTKHVTTNVIIDVDEPSDEFANTWISRRPFVSSLIAFAICTVRTDEGRSTGFGLPSL